MWHCSIHTLDWGFLSSRGKTLRDIILKIKKQANSKTNQKLWTPNIVKYLAEHKGHPGYLWLAYCKAAAHHFSSALGGTFLHAVPKVEETAASPAGCRHRAGRKCGQRGLHLWTGWLRLSVQLNGMLPLEWVDVGDGLLQDHVWLFIALIHGLWHDPLPKVTGGHLPGRDSGFEEVE